jgi:hypothetical protein
VKRNIILTLLTAVILFGFSFTFSSCKACDKKEKKPTDRGGKTSTEGDNKTTSGDDDNISDDGNTSDNPNLPSTPSSDTTEPDIPDSKPAPAPKEKLKLSDIESLVAGYAYTTSRAVTDAMYKSQAVAENKWNEAKTAGEKLGDLMKLPVVAEAKNSGDIIRVNAIELLWLMAGYKVANAEVWKEWAAAGGVWSEVPQEVNDAVALARAKWKAERDAPAKRPVADIAQALFVEAAKSKGSTAQSAIYTFWHY